MPPAWERTAVSPRRGRGGLFTYTLRARRGNARLENPATGRVGRSEPHGLAHPVLLVRVRPRSDGLPVSRVRRRNARPCHPNHRAGRSRRRFSATRGEFPVRWVLTAVSPSRVEADFGRFRRGARRSGSVAVSPLPPGLDMMGRLRESHRPPPAACGPWHGQTVARRASPASESVTAGVRYIGRLSGSSGPSPAGASDVLPPSGRVSDTPAPGLVRCRTVER